MILLPFLAVRISRGARGAGHFFHKRQAILADNPDEDSERRNIEI